MTWRRVDALTARGFPYSYWERVMPRVPDQLLDAIVFLYPDEESAREGFGVGGTGFLVNAVSQTTGRTSTFLVTNTHVACRDLVARGNTAKGFDTLKIRANAWTAHPDGDDVSAAAVRIPKGWNAEPWNWADIAPTAERLTEFNVGIGDEVVMVGRYIGHEGRERNQPVARFGNIALMDGKDILDGRGMRVEAYLVEMHSLPGYSGSPVFVYIPPGSYRGNAKMMPFYSETTGLLGIDTGHKQETGAIYLKGTHTKIDEPWEVRQNAGVAIVCPWWKINELLEDLVAERDETEQEQPKETELASSDAAEGDEFYRFEDLTRKLVNTPKPKPGSESGETDE